MTEKDNIPVITELSRCYAFKPEVKLEPKVVDGDLLIPQICENYYYYLKIDGSLIKEIIKE